MYTEKVVNENGDSKQWLCFGIANYIIVLGTDFIERFWCFEGGKRREQNFCMSVRVSGTDVVLHILRAAAHRIIHMTVQNFMELQDKILCDGNGIKIFVNDIQHIAIPGDFLLVPVFWRGLFFDQLSDARTGRYNSFNGIGCLCTLNFGDFYQFGQFCRSLFQVKFLFARCFIYCGNVAEYFGIPGHVLDFCIIK